MRNRAIIARAVAGGLAAVAALMFFFPLLTFQIPFAGEQQVSGSQVAAKVRDLRDKIRSAYGDNQNRHQGGIHLPRPQRGPAGEAQEGSALPLSVRAAWLIPFFILTAIVCALVAFAGVWVRARVARWASAAGAVSSLLALAHIAWMNSDIHNLLQQSLGGSGSHNPLSGLAQAVGGMLIQNFQIEAGAGLYALTVCLVLAAIATLAALPA